MSQEPNNPIDKITYEELLRSLKLGNSIAEFDIILDDARVSTPTFEGVIRDEYDIVTGRKGAGKTAIFRIVTHELSSFYLREHNTIILNGVNGSGESIFNHFREHFGKFDEQQFENFWKLYLITLIYNKFLKNPYYSDYLIECEEEIKEFKKACAQAGIPDIKAQTELIDMVRWVLNIFPRVKAKGSVAVDTTNPSLFVFAGDIQTEKRDSSDSSDEVNSRTSLYVDRIGLALHKILKKSSLKIWVLLDRLDEVFDRYSMIEFNGLRGLLRAYKSFELAEEKELFKLKIFLRDDIKEFLTDNEAFKKFYPKKEVPPLAAATHIFAKESPVLSWTEEEIEQLILLRLLQSKPLRIHVGINANLARSDLVDLLRIKDTRAEYWNKIFPEKIGNTSSLGYIYRHLRDSNDVVTPRSVIDMLTAAKTYQLKKLQVDFVDSHYVFPFEAIKVGLADASKNKLDLDIYNEFPKDQQNIKKLGAYGKHKLTKKDLKILYGDKWEKVAEGLQRIGIIRLIKASNDYRVEALFRPALDITYK